MHLTGFQWESTFDGQLTNGSAVISIQKQLQSVTRTRQVTLIRADGQTQPTSPLVAY